jgi:hypothetical protein
VAHYPEPYEPKFRLISTQPLSGKVSKVAGFEVPSEFICNMFVVSDEGKNTPSKLINEYPTFSVSMMIKVTASGKPELFNVELRGNTFRRSAVMGVEFRTAYFEDSESLTPWQLKFVADFRTLLIRRAVYEVAEKWTYTKKGKSITWNFPITSEKKLNEGQEIRLRKAVEKKMIERLGEDFYKDFAKRYQSFESQGLPPIKELVKDYPDKDHRTIQRYATKCRELGYLPEAKAGRPSTQRRNKPQREGKNGTTNKAKSR